MKKNKDIIISILIPIIVIFWSFLYYKLLFINNILISLDDLTNKNIFNILLQHIIVNAPVIILLVIGLKKFGNKNLFLNFPHKNIWKIILSIFVIIYFLLIFYGISISHNIIKVFYNAIFYLLFVSFMEEYIYRSLIPLLQKNKLPHIVEYLLPNTIFSLSHFVMIFVDNSGTTGITTMALFVFFITTIIFGIVMELLKRKSESLYLPIVAHAIYDFYGEIMLWI